LNPTLLIQIIYSAASIQGLFLSLLLFRTKINQPANRILAILLLILSGHLILVGFDNRDFFSCLSAFKPGIVDNRVSLLAIDFFVCSIYYANSAR
jgi:hypothetical protein